MTRVLVRGGHLDTKRDIRNTNTEKKHVNTQQKGGHLQAKKREASRETKPENTLMEDFQPPELRENKFVLLKSPSL